MRSSGRALLLSRRRLLQLGCGLAAIGARWPGAVAANASSSSAGLRSPFPQPVAQPAAAREKPWTCDPPPAPMRTVKGVSKYDPKDKSRIDPDREAAGRAATKPVNDFEKAISGSADAVASGGAAPGQAACAWTWLAAWAREGALTGPGVDEAVRKWTLAALSSAVLKLQTYGSAPAEALPAVHDWLRHLGDDVRNDYSRDLDRASHRNNHLYWAAWAATVTGVAVDDRSLFDWGLARYQAALGDIQPDGSLPLETQRGSRALGYHGFALGPLVMIAEAGEANGVPLYQAQGSSLQRLGGFVLGAFADPGILTKLSGVEQEIDDAIKPSNLAWVEPYYRRTRDARAERWLRSMRPLKRSGLGGDLTMLYGVALA